MKSNKSSYEFSVMPTAVVDMEARAYSDGVFTETEDEGFYGGPNKHTTNIGWLVGTPTYPKSPHIDIYEAGQVKPPPDLNVKEVVVPNSFGYHLSRSKSVCDLSKEPLGSTLSEKSKFSTLERKRVMEWKPQDSTQHFQPFTLIKKLSKKKKECPSNEKPDVVKTHFSLRQILSPSLSLLLDPSC